VFEGLRTLIAPQPAGPDAGPDAGKITLREVLRRNWNELWYQPKIDLRSKRLVGAEGLVRARRPDGTMHSAGGVSARRQGRRDAGFDRARHPRRAARL
jgi:hypothetical protein